MEMQSDHQLPGRQLDEAVPLTVHWNKSMLFNGKFAEFHGGIQAVQENARMAGQSLQVFFDRPISLKEGNKAEQPAKVQNLVCDSDVRVEDSTIEGDKLIKYQRIQAPSLVMTQLEPEDDNPRRAEASSPGNEVRASGPGNVPHDLQRGGDDPGPRRPDRPAGDRPDGPNGAGRRAPAMRSRPLPPTRMRR